MKEEKVPKKGYYREQNPIGDYSSIMMAVSRLLASIFSLDIPLGSVPICYAVSLTYATITSKLAKKASFAKVSHRLSNSFSLT